MELDPQEASEIRKELLVGFHRQFAENQRAREGAFLRLLTFFGVLLAAYAVMLQGVLGIEQNTIHPRQVQLFQILISLLLLSGSWVVVTISNNFRRDQYVNVRIRKACGLVGDDEVFPSSYDPQAGLRRWGLWAWMPDFFLIFFWLFAMLQLAVTGVFGIVLVPRLDTTVLTFGSTIAMAASTGALVASIIVLPWHYRTKLLSVMEVDSSQYGARRVYIRRLQQLFGRSSPRP